MDNSASKVGSRDINSNLPRIQSFSKLKPDHGFTIAIIICICGLIVGEAGLIGRLSNMPQLNTIIMMSSGVGSGVLLIISIIVKNRKRIDHKHPNKIMQILPSIVSSSEFPSSTPASSSISIRPPVSTPSIGASRPITQDGLVNGSETERNSVASSSSESTSSTPASSSISIRPPVSTPSIGASRPITQDGLLNGSETERNSVASSSSEIASSTRASDLAGSIPPPVSTPSIDASLLIDTKGGLVYGPEAWIRWKVEILDDVPPAPIVDLSKKDKVLLYIPKKIRPIGGSEQNLTLKVLKEICGQFALFNKDVEKHFGDRATFGGWVLIDKYVIPESRGNKYETHLKMVEERSGSLPSVIEVTVMILMVYAFTGERLCGREPWTYARCLERYDKQYSVMVGGFGQDGLIVTDSFLNFDRYCVICAWRDFNN